MQYLAFIDGLRALAVAFVFIFHLNPEWLPGGFIGVDIFFVISGFLISTLLFKRVNEKKFYLDFVLARCRRLIPAYLVVLVVTTCAATVLLLPNELKLYTESLLYSLIFISNIFFYLNSGYFDGASEQLLLLHTWSLSVEWQFYVVFPFAIIIINKFLSGRYFGALFVVFILASAITIYTTYLNQSLAFYLSPFRVFELVFGGVVAVIVKGELPYFLGKIKNYRFVKVLFGLALFGLFLMAYFFKKTILFPGYYALIVTFLTGVILIIGATSNIGIFEKLLNYKPISLLGKTSYSLYLWHWPVILFTKFYIGEIQTFLEYSFVIVLSMALAFFTWLFVEDRFRKASRSNNIKLLSTGLLSILLSFSYAGFIYNSEGLQNRLTDSEMKILNVSRWENFPGKCLKTQGKDRYYDCVLGRKDVEPSVFFWGDSHAQVLAWEIDELANRKKIAVESITKGGCPPLFGAVPKITNIEKDICLQSQEAAFKLITYSENITTVIIAARWRGYQNSEMSFTSDKPLELSNQFKVSLIQSIKHILSLNKKVILVDSMPEPGFDVPETITRQSLLSQPLTTSFVNSSHSIEPWLKEYDLFSKVDMVFPDKKLCKHDKCNVLVNEDILYLDSNHLSRYAAKIIGLDNKLW
jgi:peptidoglycan/LPS O-acetylase OafA/YrhL